MSGCNSITAVERLEIESEVKKLMDTYCNLADSFRWEEWASCFEEDAVFDLPNTFGKLNGRIDILRKCKGSMDSIYAGMQHYIVNVCVDVCDASTAKATGNLIFVGVPDLSKPTEYYQSGGRYQWEFVKKNGKWRISNAVLDFIWNNGRDLGSVFSGES